jgi:class 3 adenylate cyclase
MPFRGSIFSAEPRLTELLERRAADRAWADELIWSTYGAVRCMMVTDLVGFSRRVVKLGMPHLLQKCWETERVLVPLVDRYGGTLLKMEGDSFLVVYERARPALESALDLQRLLRLQNSGAKRDDAVEIGIGLGFGRVLQVGQSDVFGPEVNAAYILGEDTAGAYDILLTKAVREDAGPIEGCRYRALRVAPPGAEKAYRLRYS